MYICIDFDGTIVDHMYPHVGQPAPGAIAWIKRFQELGGKIILHTMRSGPHLRDAVDYLKQNNIELFGINKNPTQHEWTTSPKIYGHMYIDDAAIGTPMIHPTAFKRPCVDWEKIGPLVERKLL